MDTAPEPSELDSSVVQSSLSKLSFPLPSVSTLIDANISSTSNQMPSEGNELKLGFGVGSITLATPPENLPDFKMLLLFGCGSVLLGGAECTWNNLLDRKIDSKEAKDAFKVLLESANVEYEWNLTANVEYAVEREKAKAHEEHKRNIREYKGKLVGDGVKFKIAWRRMRDACVWRNLTAWKYSRDYGKLRDRKEETLLRREEMGRRPCCAKVGLNRGAWTTLEDHILTNYILANGEGKWRDLPKRAGLKRCGKSCRLRWLNYLNPKIKRGNITEEEEDLIARLHKLLGNRWSLIAGRLPGRTDNEIKNYWNTILQRKLEGQSSPSKRKSRNKAKVKISSTTLPRANETPASSSESSPSTNVTCTEDIVATIPLNNNEENIRETSSHSHSDDVQNHQNNFSTECLDEWLTDTGSGEQYSYSMDKYFMFLLNDDVQLGKNANWEEVTYHDISSGDGLDEPTLGYWRGNDYFEQTESLDLGSLATLFETQHWP
ncbi:hypothetical protein IFM89_021595 [Coptis chinensis]|uniref:Uncharacterized protein n=1 Tax=Coptis chinensis TaxID=261450 RepID=A0A835M5X3_9MAGN|nr:hypothetical protein IFM89_021595 [Coptis chinensis]